jgi:Cupin-like domain
MFVGKSVVAWWEVGVCGTTMLENNDAAFPALFGLQEKTRRRQRIARHVHNVWTLSSSDIAGLASPIFDGRFDVLSSYVIEYYEAFSNDTRHLPFRTAEDVLSDENEIDHVHAHDLTYQDFCQKYMFKNLPVVIRGLADTWPCFRNWTKQDCNNLTVPNLSYLKERFGDDVVSVHKQLCHGFSCPQLRPEVSESCEMTLSEYVEWWTRYSNDSTDQPLLYLKDWKFASLHPYYDAYSCPTLFLDDWLNEAKNGMYRYVLW